MYVVGAVWYAIVLCVCVRVRVRVHVSISISMQYGILLCAEHLMCS